MLPSLREKKKNNVRSPFGVFCDRAWLPMLSSSPDSEGRPLYWKLVETQGWL